MRYASLCLLVALSAASQARAEEYKGAKIVKIGEKLLVTLDVGGKQVQVTAFPFLKGYGADGKELAEIGHGLRVLKEGNVVDIKTESMKLTGQPQMYISEARLIKGELQSIEVLRSLSAKNLPGGKKPREPEEGTTFTVVKFEPRRPVVLRGAGGEQITAIPSLSKALDAAGQPLPDDQLTRVLKAGNVVELRLGTSSNKQTVTIKEARLLSGELAPLESKPSAATAAADATEHRGAVLKKFGIRGSVIEVDGKEIAVGPWNPMSVFLDAKGERLSSGPVILGAIKAGSIVDVKLGPPPPRGNGQALLLEMKLVRAAQ